MWTKEWPKIERHLLTVKRSLWSKDLPEEEAPGGGQGAANYRVEEFPDHRDWVFGSVENDYE